MDRSGQTGRRAALHNDRNGSLSLPPSLARSLPLPTLSPHLFEHGIHLGPVHHGLRILTSDDGRRMPIGPVRRCAHHVVHVARERVHLVHSCALGGVGKCTARHSSGDLTAGTNGHAQVGSVLKCGFRAAAWRRRRAASWSPYLEPDSTRYTVHCSPFTLHPAARWSLRRPRRTA